MSGPNTDYDPVEVAALDPAALDAAVRRPPSRIRGGGHPGRAQGRPARAPGRQERRCALANREIGALPPSAKAEAGKRVGQARGRVGQALAARQTELEAERDERILVEEARRRHLPTGRRPPGARHPLELDCPSASPTSSSAMGWEVAEGPEVEAEWFNFDALNLGHDHPARQMQDTFFVDPPDGGLVLRTHTSPVQVRTMLEREPPIYVVGPGKVFRTDELDATHTPVFHQVEGLAVDEGLTMAHLEAPSTASSARLFGEASRTRLRPSFFPFTEPSDEIDLRCFVCRGEDAGLPHVRRLGLDRVGRLRHGQPQGAASPAASTPTSTPASRSAWASSGR